MSLRVTCDICGRGCSDYGELVTTNSVLARALGAHPVPRERDNTIDDGDRPHAFHVCRPRDGGDVGCMAHLRAGMDRAREEAAKWLEENRPHATRAPGSGPLARLFESTERPDPGEQG